MAHKICQPCLSCVQPCPAMSLPYPKSLTYYLVNDTPHGVSDTYLTLVHVSNTRTDTPQDCRIHALEVFSFRNPNYLLECDGPKILIGMGIMEGGVERWDDISWKNIVLDFKRRRNREIVANRVHRYP